MRERGCQASWGAARGVVQGLRCSSRASRQVRGNLDSSSSTTEAAQGESNLRAASSPPCTKSGPCAEGHVKAMCCKAPHVPNQGHVLTRSLVPSQGHALKQLLVPSQGHMLKRFLVPSQGHVLQRGSKGAAKNSPTVAPCVGRPWTKARPCLRKQPLVSSPPQHDVHKQG